MTDRLSALRGSAGIFFLRNEFSVFTTHSPAFRRMQCKAGCPKTSNESADRQQGMGRKVAILATLTAVLTLHF